MKSGESVITVLKQKHPNARIPDEEDFDEYEDVHVASDPFPLLFFEEDVEASATRLSGGPGPGGLDGDSLKNWLLRRGTRSARLREYLQTDLQTMLCIEQPPSPDWLHWTSSQGYAQLVSETSSCDSGPNVSMLLPSLKPPTSVPRSNYAVAYAQVLKQTYTQ